LAIDRRSDRLAMMCAACVAFRGESPHLDHYSAPTRPLVRRYGNATAVPVVAAAVWLLLRPRAADLAGLLQDHEPPC